MPNLGELRVILIDKNDRQHQSHAVVLCLRKLLEPLQSNGIVLKVVEVPPGPPVLCTLVAEVYAQPFVDKQIHMQAALEVIKRMQQEPYVVEVDSSMSAQQQVARFVVDKQKAALSDISTTEVNQTIIIPISISNCPLSESLKGLNQDA